MTRPLPRYLLCAASSSPTIKIWDLESKNMVEELRPEVPDTIAPHGHQKCLLSYEWPWLVQPRRNLLSLYLPNVLKYKLIKYFFN